MSNNENKISKDVCDKKILELLKKIGFVIDNLDHLDGVLIPRSLLLNTETYKKIQDDIPNLRKIFSSSTLTSLQKTATENQKWPLINIVRQILKKKNYKMNPIRKSNGTTQDGKKKFVRFFQIQKLKKISDCSQNIICVSETN